MIDHFNKKEKINKYKSEWLEKLKKEESQSILETLTPQKEELLKNLTKVNSTIERVKLFSKIMDDYGVDAIASLIPWRWDLWSSIVSSLYLLAEWRKIWLSFSDSLKILGYQTTDTLIGFVPVIWDITDYFFKANKRSVKLFEKHFDKLKQHALEKGITEKEIQNMKQDKSKFIKFIRKKVS